jgi:NTE family protein
MTWSRRPEPPALTEEAAMHQALFAIAMLAAAWVMTACAVRPYNAELEVRLADPTHTAAHPATGTAVAAGAAAAPYTFEARLPRNSPRHFVVLTFSGGGTRAAAFTLGVLEKLAVTTILVDGAPRRLVDEVDVITAVSGGSFTAAYFGLFGDRVYTEFGERFLYRDVQSDMLAELLSPLQWAKVAATGYSRTDVIADYLDRTLFEGRSFADLSADGRSPYIILNATDLNTGATFSFTQMQFDYLCSDLTPFPVARAVTASSAIPMVFAPLVLRNHAGPCTERMPAWVKQALAEQNPADRKFHAALALASYADPAAVPFVRLVDGGIVDNLGVRGSIMSEVNHHGRVLEMAGAFSPAALAQVEHVLVIASNTQTISGRDWVPSDADPGLLDTAQALSDATTNMLNAETTLLAQQGFDMWAAHVNATRCEACRKVTVDFSVLSFNHLPDAAERRHFSTIATSFHLERAIVDELRALPARMLDASPPFRAFLGRVGSPVPGALGAGPGAGHER